MIIDTLHQARSATDQELIDAAMDSKLELAIELAKRFKLLIEDYEALHSALDKWVEA